MSQSAVALATADKKRTIIDGMIVLFACNKIEIKK